MSFLALRGTEIDGIQVEPAEVIASALTDSDVAVRRSAVQLIALVAPPNARALLERIATIDSDPHLQEEARDGLKNMATDQP